MKRRTLVAICAHIRRTQVWHLIETGEGTWALDVNGQFPVGMALGAGAWPLHMEVVKPLKGKYTVSIKMATGEVFVFERTIRAKDGISNFRKEN
jgi:hypothetical protein